MKLPVEPWLTVLLLSVLAAGCASTPLLKEPETGPTDLQGMVYDLDRVPVSGARVEWKAGPRSSGATTDIHGRFSLSAIPFGKVDLTFTKDGYESFSWSLLFSERDQIVYVQMSSADQLYQLTVRSLDQKEWAQAAKALDRADQIRKPGGPSTFLRACLLDGQGDPAGAAALLEAYLAGAEPSLAFDLYLGDLYEKKLKDGVRARAHLETALRLKYDPEVEDRVNRLTGAQP